MAISRRQFFYGSAALAAAPGVASLLANEQGIELAPREPSLWSKELKPLAAQQVLANDLNVDVAIVGAGYTGLSCAYYLKQQRPDWDIVILDSHTIGSGASSRNSGAVYARYVGIDDQGFADRGLQRLREFIAKENIQCDFAPASTLMVYRDQSAASKAKSQLKPGEQYLSDKQMQQLGSTYYVGAVQAPGYFKVHPAKLLQAQAKAALKLGVNIFERSPVQQIDFAKTPRVITEKAVVSAKQVVVASNAYTPRLDIAQYKMLPVHQLTLATRKLSADEVNSLGLDRWDLRFEPNILPVTFSLTPSGHFFVRMVLGYENHNSSQWDDIQSARALARKLFLQRYPSLADIGFEHFWHGVTGHTALMKPLLGTMGQGNVHISAAYNGLGIMPAHYSAYLTACKITGENEPDVVFLNTLSGQLPLPGGYYRSLMFQPFMNAMMPV